MCVVCVGGVGRTAGCGREEGSCSLQVWPHSKGHELIHCSQHTQPHQHNTCDCMGVRNRVFANPHSHMCCVVVAVCAGLCMCVGSSWPGLLALQLVQAQPLFVLLTAIPTPCFPAYSRVLSALVCLVLSALCLMCSCSLASYLFKFSTTNHPTTIPQPPSCLLLCPCVLLSTCQPLNFHPTTTNTNRCQTPRPADGGAAPPMGGGGGGGGGLVTPPGECVCCVCAVCLLFVVCVGKAMV